MVERKDIKAAETEVQKAEEVEKVVEVEIKVGSLVISSPRSPMIRKMVLDLCVHLGQNESESDLPLYLFVAVQTSFSFNVYI